MMPVSRGKQDSWYDDHASPNATHEAWETTLADPPQSARNLSAFGEWLLDGLEAFTLPAKAFHHQLKDAKHRRDLAGIPIGLSSWEIHHEQNIATQGLNIRLHHTFREEDAMRWLKGA